LEVQFTKSQTELLSFQKQLRSRSTEVENLRTKVAEMEVHCTTTKTACENQRAEVAEHTKLLSDYRQREAFAANRVAELERKLETQVQVNADLEEENRRTREKLQAGRGALRDQLGNALSELAQKADEIEDLKRLNISLKREKNDAQSDNVQQIEFLQDELVQLRKQCAGVQGRQRDVQALKSENALLTNENAELRARISRQDAAWKRKIDQDRRRTRGSHAPLAERRVADENAKEHLEAVVSGKPTQHDSAAHDMTRGSRSRRSSMQPTRTKAWA